MAQTEIQELLAACPSPESGCFASDPGLIQTLLAGDVDTRVNLNIIAVAAKKAGASGNRLEDSTFNPARIQSLGRNFEGAVIVDLVEEEAKAIADLRDGSAMDRLGFDIAICAYTCARNAQSCPLNQASLPVQQ